MSCIQAIFYTEGPAEPTPHSHNTYQMLFICDGRAQLEVSGQHYAITAPAVVFLSNLETHTFSHTTADYHRYVVDIRPESAFAALAEAARLLSPFTDRPPGFSHVIPVADEAQRLSALFDLLCEEVADGGFPAGEAALLQTILRCLYRHHPTGFPYHEQAYNPAVRQLRRRFEQDPAPDVSLTALAEEYHLSESHLSHSFKKATGYSIGRYQLLCRLARAKELLLTTRLPVTAVGVECGFSDMSNFSRYFRREVGCSPSQFRQRGAAAKAD